MGTIELRTWIHPKINKVSCIINVNIIKLIITDPKIQMFILSVTYEVYPWKYMPMYIKYKIIINNF